MGIRSSRISWACEIMGHGVRFRFGLRVWSLGLRRVAGSDMHGWGVESLWIERYRGAPGMSLSVFLSGESSVMRTP